MSDRLTPAQEAAVAALQADPGDQAAGAVLRSWRYPGWASAQAIRSLRTELGLSQAQLAALVGTTQHVISRAESGRHPVGVRFLDQVAGATGRQLVIAFVARDERRG